MKAAEVTFRPGERTKFHTHGGVQILYVTAGNGIVATREEKREVSEGDLVLFPAGEEHWHGTTDDAESAFSHVYFIAEPTDSGLTVIVNEDRRTTSDPPRSGLIRHGSFERQDSWSEINLSLVR
ncbi:MAG: cupin domain-containing protein [bacterium]